MRRFLLGGLVGAGLVVGVGAQGAGGSRGVEVIAPVFHQLFAFQLPGGFSLNESEHANAKFYLRETVLKGETVERWTQMITLTGAQGAGAVAGLTPISMSGRLAAGYKKACPASYGARPVGEMTISGRPAYVALVGCGSVADEHGAAGAVHSEAALIVVIAGDQDFYTLQWAERGVASEKPMVFDGRWQERFKQMEPIRVCPIVAGEQAPYPSCVGR